MVVVLNNMYRKSRLSRLPRVGFNANFNNYRKNRRSKIKKLRSSIPPSLSTRAQRFGPGSTIRRINIDGSIPGPYTVKDIGVSLASSIEFSTVCALFEFYKVIAVKVTFFPYNYTNNEGRVWLQVNFDVHVPTSEQLDVGDKTKMLGPVNSRNKVFKFIPPASIGTYSSSQSADPFLMNGWIPTENRMYPIKMISGHTIGGTVVLQTLIEVVILFRGTSDHYTISNKLNKVNEEDIKEEKMEEEDAKEVKKEVIEEDVEGLKNKIEELRKQLESLKLEQH